MTKTYITVCKNTVLSNKKNNRNKPPLRISDGKYGRPRYAHEVKVIGNSRVIYAPNSPLPWGARAWIECDSTIPVA